MAWETRRGLGVDFLFLFFANSCISCKCLLPSPRRHSALTFLCNDRHYTIAIGNSCICHHRKTRARGWAVNQAGPHLHRSHLCHELHGGLRQAALSFSPGPPTGNRGKIILSYRTGLLQDNMRDALWTMKVPSCIKRITDLCATDCGEGTMCTNGGKGFQFRPWPGATTNWNGREREEPEPSYTFWRLGKQADWILIDFN